VEAVRLQRLLGSRQGVVGVSFHSSTGVVTDEVCCIVSLVEGGRHALLFLRSIRLRLPCQRPCSLSDWRCPVLMLMTTLCGALPPTHPHAHPPTHPL
jgi:hypothetical protein